MFVKMAIKKTLRVSLRVSHNLSKKDSRVFIFVSIVIYILERHHTDISTYDFYIIFIQVYFFTSRAMSSTAR